MTDPGDDDDDVAYSEWRKDWTSDDWDRLRGELPIRRYIGPDFDKLVGINVQTYRTARGLSQAELAAAMSADGEQVAQQTIQKIEKGTRPMRYSEAVRICDVLRVSPLALTDNGQMARANSYFMKTLGEVSAAKSDIESLADRLSQSLLDLSELVAHERLESQASKRAALHFIEGAKMELVRNWGKLLNQQIMTSLRKLPAVTAIREEVDAPTYVEILKLHSDEFRFIEPTDPYPTEPRQDESET
jgi:transcriptional regulator with XRE-family HTH domain